MSEAHLPAYVAELRRRRPRWLHGYPSLLALLAAHVLARGTELGYAVRWITVGAESLLPQQAELIALAFGVRPRQHYGMAEAVANFSECERGALHVDEDFAGVEFLPTDDGLLRVVGTNLSNLATPLLRYEVGDVASLAPDGCGCGRAGRVVSTVDGRQEDYIVLPTGARVGRMDHVFKDLVNIREAQLVQRRVGEVVVRLVPGPRFGPADERRLLAEMRARVGADTSVVVERVDALPRARTGKLRFVVSELRGGQLVAAADVGAATPGGDGRG